MENSTTNEGLQKWFILLFTRSWKMAFFRVPNLNKCFKCEIITNYFIWVSQIYQALAELPGVAPGNGSKSMKELTDANTMWLYHNATLKRFFNWKFIIIIYRLIIILGTSGITALGVFSNQKVSTFPTKQVKTQFWQIWICHIIFSNVYTWRKTMQIT